MKMLAAQFPGSNNAGSLFFGFVSLFSILLAVPELAAQDRLKDLYQKAQKEKTIVAEGTHDNAAIQPVIAAFQSRYPGLNVEWTSRTSGQTVERLITEARTGRVGLDVNHATIGSYLPLVKRQLTTKVDWSQWIAKEDIHTLFDDTFLVWYHLPGGFIYNTKLVSREQAPKTWESLLDPKWQGQKMVLDARANFLDHLPIIWGEEKAIAYFHKLAAQKPILVPRARVALERVIAGEAPLASMNLGPFQQAKADGAPVEWAPVGPAKVSVYGLFIPKNAPHPNAARLWISWLMSPEGQRIHEHAAFYALVGEKSNSEAAKLLRSYGTELWYEDTAEKAERRGKYGKIAEKILGGFR